MSMHVHVLCKSSTCFYLMCYSLASTNFFRNNIFKHHLRDHGQDEEDKLRGKSFIQLLQNTEWNKDTSGFSEFVLL